MPAKDRLRHLLELAADARSETRAALKRELQELLADWQGDDDARAPFEALLAKIAREEASGPKLINQLRAGNRDGAIAALSALSGSDGARVSDALDEESGTALAALCHAAGLSRALFSDIAILAGPARGLDLAEMKRVLDAFETPAESPRLRANSR